MGGRVAPDPRRRPGPGPRRFRPARHVTQIVVGSSAPQPAGGSCWEAGPSSGRCRVWPRPSFHGRAHHRPPGRPARGPTRRGFRADVHCGFRHGAGGGNRTHDLTITNRLLCQLSYTGAGSGDGAGGPSVRRTPVPPGVLAKPPCGWQADGSGRSLGARTPSPGAPGVLRARWTGPSSCSDSSSSPRCSCSAASRPAPRPPPRRPRRPRRPLHQPAGRIHVDHDHHVDGAEGRSRRARAGGQRLGPGRRRGRHHRSAPGGRVGRPDADERHRQRVHLGRVLRGRPEGGRPVRGRARSTCRHPRSCPTRRPHRWPRSGRPTSSWWSPPTWRRPYRPPPPRPPARAPDPPPGARRTRTAHAGGAGRAGPTVCGPGPDGGALRLRRHAGSHRRGPGHGRVRSPARPNCCTAWPGGSARSPWCPAVRPRSWPNGCPRPPARGTIRGSG